MEFTNVAHWRGVIKILLTVTFLLKKSHLDLEKKTNLDENPQVVYVKKIFKNQKTFFLF